MISNVDMGNRMKELGPERWLIGCLSLTVATDQRHLEDLFVFLSLLEEE